MFFSFIRNKKGFTMTELIVAIALAAILLIPLSNFFIFSLNTNELAEAQIHVQNEVQFAMNSLADAAMATKEISTIASGPDSVIGSSGEVSISQVVFKDSEDEEYEFVLNNNILTLEYDGTTTTIANNIQEIALEPIDNPSTTGNESFSNCSGLIITVTGSKSIGFYGNVESTLSSRVNLRNK